MSAELRVILCALAAYRCAHMMTFEEGPFEVFQRWRDFVGAKSWVGRGFQCCLCMTFWLTLAFLLLPEFLSMWVGAAGIALLIHKALYRE